MLKSEEDLHQNYPLTTHTSLEHDFLKLLTVEQVMDMFKDGSYDTKLKEFAANSKQDKEPGSSLSSFTGSASHKAVTYQQLFHKQLTLSDVGKLNRLVIPKRYAEAYFPPVSTEEKEAGVPDDVPLPVYDREMNCWNFRYLFWRSSQSYVFTKGWIRFVKIKKLMAGDVVKFYRCECREEQKAFYMIDVESSNRDAASEGGSAENRVDLQLGIGQVPSNESGPSGKTKQLRQNKADNVIVEVAPPQPQPQEEKKTFIRLFGVNIS
ncbi:hypothetical protein MKW94_007548 [Papaver nudicaule]|uniref:TF-B3 domain-containing protein n=1 Tax=Papaver nudicaule TaxID=74823 RepID=A0AA41UZQ5_PAPNU|nr:hypothetical protein [Papaver nudicaule]